MQKLSLFLLSLFITLMFFVNIWTHFGFNETVSESSSPQRIYKWFTSMFYVKEYAFFSPDIMDGFALVILEKKNDSYKNLPIQFYSGEMQNKLLSLIHKLYESNETRDALSYSLAIHFFQENPGTDSILLTLSQYKLPTLMETRYGSKPYIEPFFIQEYSLK